MHKPRVHLDFETGSACELKTAGVYRYMEHPTTRIWGFRWGFTPDMILQWRPGYPDPVVLLEHVAAGGTFVCHNATFERICWNWLLTVRYVPHWPKLTIEQQSCTMARAAAVSLPQGLDDLAEVLNQKQRKDMHGYSLMMKMAKPRKIHPNGDIDWWDTAELTDPRAAALEATKARRELEKANGWTVSPVDDDIPF